MTKSPSIPGDHHRRILNMSETGGEDEREKEKHEEPVTTAVVHVRPRRKSGEAAPTEQRDKEKPLAFTYDTISKYFGMRLPQAARALGICGTSLKQICRKLGIERWPYPRGGLEEEGEPGGSEQESGSNDTYLTHLHHHITHPPSTLAHQILPSRSVPEFVQGWAVPTTDWLTPNHVTEMAEHSTTFWDMGLFAVSPADLEYLEVREKE